MPEHWQCPKSLACSPEMSHHVLCLQATLAAHCSSQSPPFKPLSQQYHSNQKSFQANSRKGVMLAFQISYSMPAGSIPLRQIQNKEGFNSKSLQNFIVSFRSQCQITGPKNVPSSMATAALPSNTTSYGAPCEPSSPNAQLAPSKLQRTCLIPQTFPKATEK